MIAETAMEANESVPFCFVVDICITTSWHELEGVCMIADLLARRTFFFPSSLETQLDNGFTDEQ